MGAGAAVLGDLQQLTIRIFQLMFATMSYGADIVSQAMTCSSITERTSGIAR
jgi:hypothetical protein